MVALDGSEGIGHHWLFGPGMRLDFARPPRVKGRDIVFFAPHRSEGELPPAARGHTTLFRTWGETVEWLSKKHGERATVSVYPCATIQLATG